VTFDGADYVRAVSFNSWNRLVALLFTGLLGLGGLGRRKSVLS
jgi:hypothetical protein